jgi:hypothetical protein
LTYGQYAFPSLAIPSIEANKKKANTQTEGLLLEARVPAARGVMNCTSVPTDMYTVNFDGSHNCGQAHRGLFSSTPMININFLVPAGCPRFADLCSFLPPVGSFFSSFAEYNDAASGANMTTGPIKDGCPLIALAYGQLSGPNTTSGANVVFCRPYIAQFDIEATFTLPNYTLDASKPPKAIDSTSRVLYTTVGNGYTDEMQSVVPLLSGLDSWFMNITTSSLTNGLDPWFKALVHGIDGIPAAELLGSGNVGKLIGGLERVFGILMAQAMNSYTRVHPPTNISVPTTLPLLEATVIDPNHMRLVQSGVSTRILQGLLGAMMLCAILTFFTMDTKRILPKAPCSIAAVASLLEGSELLSESHIPPGTEWCDDKELKKRGVFQGWLYSLSWWNYRQDEGRRFGVDVEEIAAMTVGRTGQGDDHRRVALPTLLGGTAYTLSDDAELVDSSETNQGGSADVLRQVTFHDSIRRSLERRGYNI